jgi:hypothetical protein
MNVKCSNFILFYFILFIFLDPQSLSLLHQFLRTIYTLNVPEHIQTLMLLHTENHNAPYVTSELPWSSVKLVTELTSKDTKPQIKQCTCKVKI